MDRLEALAREVRAQGGEAHAIACDVADEEACRTGVARAAQALGGLDALVYAPGLSPLSLLTEAGADAWLEVLRVNLVGASLMTAAALPHLRASQGRAVYVGSYAARQTLPGIALYSVSKLALAGLVSAWRTEHPDVDFTHVVLGNTLETEFAASWGPEKTAAISRLWLERGVFPAPRMMPLAAAAEAIVSVLALRGFVDEIGVMPRARDGPIS
jgi:NAD(P)-dependent dehydrogenase (short-subunit alcohol dehydrogenase family)